MTANLLFAAVLLVPTLGAAAGEETAPIPEPETKPTWDETWAHPEVSDDLPGFDESLGPLEDQPEGAPGRRAGEPKAGDSDTLFDALAGTEGAGTPSVEQKAAPPPLSEALAKARRSGISWDLQIEVGATVAATFWRYEDATLDDWTFIDNPDFPIFFRLRTGLLVLREPWYFGVGPSVSYGGVGEWAVGAQADITSTWGGVWAQAEMAWSFEHELIASISAGYRLMGVELRAATGGRDIAVIFKVRGPIGLIAFVRGYLDKQEKDPKAAGE